MCVLIIQQNNKNNVKKIQTTKKKKDKNNKTTATKVLTLTFVSEKKTSKNNTMSKTFLKYSVSHMHFFKQSKLSHKQSFTHFQYTTFHIFDNQKKKKNATIPILSGVGSVSTKYHSIFKQQNKKTTKQKKQKFQETSTVVVVVIVVLWPFFLQQNTTDKNKNKNIVTSNVAKNTMETIREATQQQYHRI